jgi:hypothetical protein
MAVITNDSFLNSSNTEAPIQIAPEASSPELKKMAKRDVANFGNEVCEAEYILYPDQVVTIGFTQEDLQMINQYMVNSSHKSINILVETAVHCPALKANRNFVKGSTIEHVKEAILSGTLLSATVVKFMPTVLTQNVNMGFDFSVEQSNEVNQTPLVTEYATTAHKVITYNQGLSDLTRNSSSFAYTKADAQTQGHMDHTYVSLEDIFESNCLTSDTQVPLMVVNSAEEDENEETLIVA